jgi:hypothetical protein
MAEVSLDALNGPLKWVIPITGRTHCDDWQSAGGLFATRERAASTRWLYFGRHPNCSLPTEDELPLPSQCQTRLKHHHFHRLGLVCLA